MKPVLCFALLIEAKPYIELGKCKQVKQFKDIKLYQGNDFDCLVMGLGAIKAATAIGWVNAQLNAKTLFANIGLCGSAHKPLFSSYSIAKVTDAVLQKTFYPELLPNALNLPLANLLTVPKPANSIALNEANDLLVDMEGYAFCKAAAMFVSTSEIMLLKFVSDNGNEHFFNTTWQQPYTNAAEYLLTNVLNHANNLQELKSKYDFSVNHWLELVQQKLSLTFTQQAMLTDALKFALNLKGAESIAQVIEQIPEGIKQKELKNKWVQNILSQLQHV